MVVYKRTRDRYGRLTVIKVMHTPGVGTALLKVVVDPVESSVSAVAMLLTAGEVKALATNARPSTALSWLALTDAAKAYRKPVLGLAGDFLAKSA